MQGSIEQPAVLGSAYDVTDRICVTRIGTGDGRLKRRKKVCVFDILG
jgi:hypothetical protein